MGKCPDIPRVIGLVLLVALLTGCAQRSVVISRPSWHRLESGVYKMTEGGTFYGIGRASGVQNLTLLRATADNHARKELAGVMQRFVTELARSANLGSDPGWTALTAEEQRQALGILVHNALQQAVISDHWSDSQQPRLLALCRLDLAAFKQVLSDTAALDKDARAAMLAEADTVHARLSHKFAY